MRKRTSPCFLNLLTQTQLGNQGTITLDVLLGQVVQQAAALTDHHLHAAAAVEVMGMNLQMGGELADALGEDSDLDLRGTSVVLVGTVGLDDSLFIFRAEISWRASRSPPE